MKINATPFFSFKRILLISSLFLAIIPVSFLSIAIGAYNLPISDVVKCLLNPHGENPAIIAYTIVWFYRIPRTIGALITGAVLAVAGALIQGITRNPLASPFTLGVSSAASFGAGLVIIAGVKLALLPQVFLQTPEGYMIITLAAFTICFLHTLLILTLLFIKGFSPESIVLAGIAMAYMYSAGITFLEYFAGESSLKEYIFWIMGDLTRVNWGKIYFLLATLLITILAVYLFAWDLNALSLGDDVAKSLGVDPRKLRFKVAFMASLTTATVISITGPIPFICIMAPHIARLIIGSDNRYLLPTSIAIGSILLTISDIIARTALKPIELPVGAVTNALGASFFISMYMSIKKGKVMSI